MLILAGSYRLPETGGEAALAEIATLVAATRAEPGCLAYSHAVDAVEPNLVRVFEIFADAEALAAHRASAHMAHWRARWAELGLSGRDMSEYEIANWRRL